MTSRLAGRHAPLGLSLALVLASLPGAGQAPAGGAPAPARLPVPQCGAALPLDAGQAFAGPRFLIWHDQVALFEPAPPTAQPEGRTPEGRTPEGRTPDGRTPVLQPTWRLQSVAKLPASPPAKGLDRARVKWRDGGLWMKAGRRVYQRDPASGQWFLMADPKVDFRDFEVDLKGRVLLVATADPDRRTYRALLEGMAADRQGTEVLQEYPQGDLREAFRRLSPMAAATLLTGYESVLVDEFLVLYNPLARRLFVYRDLDGSFREAALGVPTRAVADLVPAPGAVPEPPGDLCWQVLPKARNEAWVVVPARTVAPAGGRPGEASGRPVSEGAAARSDGARDGLVAIALDLLEAKGSDPVALPGCRLPVFPDARGRLASLSEALASYRGPASPATGNPADRP